MLKPKVGPVVASERLRVYIGCGLHPAAGWINVDKAIGPTLDRHRHVKHVLYLAHLLPRTQYELNWPPGIVRMDVRKGLPWPDESVEAIVCDAVLGFLDRPQGERFLTECLRVLRPGHRIRLRVDDLEARARGYLEAKAAGHADAADRFFARYLAFGTDPEGPPIFRIIKRAVPGYDHNSSTWLYDFDSLALLVRAVGFVGVSREDAASGHLRGIMALETEQPHHLVIEACKPHVAARTVK
jgi:SAM-dependent methyltransferase